MNRGWFKFLCYDLFRDILWEIPQSEEMNQWLSAVVFFGDSSGSSNMRLEFAAENLQSSFLSLDLDDIVVTNNCGKHWL